MIIVTNSEDKIVDMFPVRGNTIVKEGFNVYSDITKTFEDVNIGDVYKPELKEDNEDIWKEE